MRRALITGATGFIGSHLARHLVEYGWEVRCLVRPDSPRHGRLPDKAIAVNGELSDRRSLEVAVRGCDEVYHLAGLTKSLRARDYWECNVRGTGHLAAACARQPTPPRFLFVSSLAASGPTDPDRPRVESDAEAPVSRYGESKLAAEQTLRRYADRLPITVLRPGIVLGEGDKDGFPLFSGIWYARVILVAGHPATRYSVVHARDLVEAIRLATVSGERLGSQGSRGIYHVAGQDSWTLTELGRAIGNVMHRTPVRALRIPGWLVKGVAAGCEAVSRIRRTPFILGWDKAREATAGSWIANDDKLRQLGWQPLPLASRLRQTAAWYFEQGWLRGEMPAVPKMGGAAGHDEAFRHSPIRSSKANSSSARDSARNTGNRDWAGRQ